MPAVEAVIMMREGEEMVALAWRRGAKLMGGTGVSNDGCKGGLGGGENTVGRY